MGSIRCIAIEDNGQTIVKEIHKVVVHRLRVSDVEDPDLYAAQPLWEWEKSPQGQFIMANAIEKPMWKRNINHSSYYYDYIVVAELEKSKLAEFYLRWGKP